MMMEAIDAFFGQNWVDQAQREHQIHPNTGFTLRSYRDLSCEDVVKRTGWSVVTYLMLWEDTEQGHSVWQRRYEKFDCEPILDSIR